MAKSCGTVVAGNSIEKQEHPMPAFRRVFNRTLLDGGQGSDFSLHQFHIEPGGEIPLHIHEHHQEAVYVLAGQASIVVGGSVYQVGPGFLFNGPRGCSLAVRNVGEENLEAIAVFSPAIPSASFAYEEYLWPDDERWPAEQSPERP